MSLSKQQIIDGKDNTSIGTRLVSDLPFMRVWQIKLAPGETLPPHRHDRPYFWTVLTDGQGQSSLDDGRELAICYKAGDTKYFPALTPEAGFVHDLVNTGDDDLIFVTVEFNLTHPGETK